MELPAQAVALLRRPDVYLYLATTNEDGSPHVAPLWSDVDLGTGMIVLNTAEGRRKVRNIRRDPRVMLAAHAPEAPSPALIVTGEVVEISAEGALEHIDELARRYDGEPWGPVAGQVRLRMFVRADRVQMD